MTSASGGLNTKHGPALDLPGRFMILGMLMLAIVALLSPFAYPLLLDNFYSPRLVAFVHLNTLGVVAAILMGASYQLIPVVLQTPLASVRFGRVSFWFYLAGILCFLPSVHQSWRLGMALGAALVTAGLVIYLIIVGATLARAPRQDVVSWHIALAMAGLAGGVLGGFLLALNKQSDLLGSTTFRILAAHATLMIAGWVIVMFNGVAYRLVGMFTLSEDQLWHRVAWAELVCSVAGAWMLAASLLLQGPRAALAIGALFLLGGQLLFGIQLSHLYRVRRRGGYDVHIPYALTAIACGLAATGLLLAGILGSRPIGSGIWIAVGWLAISGLAISAIQGFFYKIATFLVWLHSYAPVAGRSKVPRLEDLYNRQLARAGWALWATALAGSLVAIFLSNRPLAVVAGTAALAGLGCFLVNVARIASHVRRSVSVRQQFATPNPISRAGKEGQHR